MRHMQRSQAWHMMQQAKTWIKGRCRYSYPLLGGYEHYEVLRAWGDTHSSQIFTYTKSEGVLLAYSASYLGSEENITYSGDYELLMSATGTAATYVYYVAKAAKCNGETTISVKAAGRSGSNGYYGDCVIMWIH